MLDWLNPLLFNDGRPVLNGDDWTCRRVELIEFVIALEYGPIPDAPGHGALQPIQPSVISTDPRVQTAKFRVASAQPDFAFSLALYCPRGNGPFPVIVDGDGCWPYITDDIIGDIAARGYALALFDRTEIVSDCKTDTREATLYRVAPTGDYGALSAWAWGYHRVIDGLVTLPLIDADRIATTGHSRGGKAALLAGATDERIKLAAPNNSGCGGAGSFHYPDPGGEGLDDIMRAFGYWFSPRLREYVGRAEELPFDQHAVLALIAPRALLTTEARGDIWASPQGTRRMHEAALPAYQLLGKEQAIGIHYRDGGHGHTRGDWSVLLDFADFVFFDKPTTRDFNERDAAP